MEKSFPECGLSLYTHLRSADSSIHGNGGIFMSKTEKSSLDFCAKRKIFLKVQKPCTFNCYDDFRPKERM